MTQHINPVTEQIGKLLADDPICGGRVASGTIEAIAALVSCPSGDDVERAFRNGYAMGMTAGSLVDGYDRWFARRY